MINELLSNGFITFNLVDSILDELYNNSLNNNLFNRIKVSHDSIAYDTPSKSNGFKLHELEKEDFIKDPNLKQIWHWKLENNNINLNNFLYDIFKEFYDYDVDNVVIHSISTLFTKDCFIDLHRDGATNDRIAGILIYLNKNYDENNGGLLILKNEEKVIPEFGKVVLLDYTKNNIEHEVTRVIEKDRKAICAFIHKKIN